jgi:hypothetical protein
MLPSCSTGASWGHHGSGGTGTRCSQFQKVDGCMQAQLLRAGCWLAAGTGLGDKQKVGERRQQCFTSRGEQLLHQLLRWVAASGWDLLHSPCQIGNVGPD